MKVVIVIPTYEPFYIYHRQLERFYTENFDSFLNPEGDLDVELVLSDFASSQSYKAFLRNYVSSRPGCYLIDGDQEASRFVAFNLALRHFEYDYVVHGACDLRVRDKAWLKTLLNDFDDEQVQVTVPTVDGDGNRTCEQNQIGPIDRESRPIGLYEQYNVHCPVYTRRFFQHFDNRHPDIFDWHFIEYCLQYQMAALGYIGKVNFRVNLIHGSQEVLAFKPANQPAGWGRRNGLHEADRQRFLSRSTHFLRYIPASGGNVTKKIRLHMEAIKSQGWRYFYLSLFSKRAFEDFIRLDVPTKEATMKSLFYRPISDYDRYSYSICQSNFVSTSS